MKENDRFYVKSNGSGSAINRSQLRASCAEKKSRCDLEVGKEAGMQAGVALEPSSHVPSMRCLPPFTLETCQPPSVHPTS